MNKKTIRLIINLLVISPALIFSQDIIIGVHTTGLIGDMNINQSMSGGVTLFEPSGTPCHLTDVTLNNALSTGDVVIRTTSGDIIFSPGTFVAKTAGRTLTLEPNDDLIFTLSVDTMGGTGNEFNTNLLNVVVMAGDTAILGVAETRLVGGTLNVTAGEVIIQNGGMDTGGGNASFVVTNKFTSSDYGIYTRTGKVNIQASDIEIRGGGIQTDGGDIDFNATNDINLFGHSARSQNGSVRANAKKFKGLNSNLFDTGTGDITIEVTDSMICSGHGFITNGGEIKISATYAEFNESGILSENSKVSINLTGSLYATGGINTTNKDIDIAAFAAVFKYDGVETSGIGNLNLNITDSVFLSGDGAKANNYFSTGTALTAGGTGIKTTGNISINHTGNVNVSGGGLFSNGTINSTGVDFRMESTKITSNGGNITLCHTGVIDIDGGGMDSGIGNIDIGTLGDVTIRESGIITDGGNVAVRAKDQSITVSGAAINTGFGMSSGGTLSKVGNVVENDPIQVGGGNIILDTISEIACLPVADIPTLGQWALINLAFLMLIVGVNLIRKSEFESLKKQS